MARAAFPERLMHIVWREHEVYLRPALQLSDGSPLHILQAGRFNDYRGGPDFIGAELLIDGLKVQGDVELHTSLDEWEAHGHSADARYANVVLHVVLTRDDEHSSIAPTLPTLALSENMLLDERTAWERLFDTLYARKPELHCFPHNMQVPLRFKRRTIEKFAEARLDELIERFASTEDVPHDFAALLYQRTLEALGYAENRAPMRELAMRLPIEALRTIRRYSTDVNRVAIFEAWFLRMSGLLPMPSAEFTDDANAHLTELHAIVHWLEPELERGGIDTSSTLDISDWAFFRIRPANSPYRRVAMAAALAEHLFSRSLPTAQLLMQLEDLSAPLALNHFWESRTSYSDMLPAPERLIGDERKRAIALNVAMPAAIVYAATAGASAPEIRTLRGRWMNTRSKSSARYINVVRQELLESESVKTVREEQGALLLTRSFCETGRCSQCPIGQRLIQNGWNAPVRIG